MLSLPHEFHRTSKRNPSVEEGGNVVTSMHPGTPRCHRLRKEEGSKVPASIRGKFLGLPELRLEVPGDGPSLCLE